MASTGECPATQLIVECTQGDAELTCDLWAGHVPPIHWDKEAGVHWFRMEDQPGYEPGAELAYERPAG